MLLSNAIKDLIIISSNNHLIILIQVDNNYFHISYNYTHSFYLNLCKK